MLDFADVPVTHIDLGQVVSAVRTVRIANAGMSETEIHDAICKTLATNGIPFRREYRFGPHCRADIWVDGIVIEVKKERPARADLWKQVERYAAQAAVRSVVVVMERSISLSPTVYGKPLEVVSLNALWGIAL